MADALGAKGGKVPPADDKTAVGDGQPDGETPLAGDKMTLTEVQALGKDVAREPKPAPRAEGEKALRSNPQDKATLSGSPLPDQDRSREAELEEPQRGVTSKETADVAPAGRQTAAEVAGETGERGGAGDQGSLPPSGKPDAASKQQPALQGEVRSRST